MDGVPSHVIVRGNNRQDIFITDGDRIQFHRWLAELSEETGLAIHAYVFMSNHVHLLATGRKAKSLPMAIQCLGRRYVGYFNHMHGRTGTLWEGRYKASLVESERYLLTCHRYIELNPVRAGMVSHPSQHPWSSHGRCGLGRPDSLVTPHELYMDLSLDEEQRLANFRALFGEEIDPWTLHRIRDTVQNGWVLGSPSFCRKVAASGGRRPTRLPLGRPCADK